ncbi:MAG: hypothetical protein D6798_13985, partial [Deltaproteobacteria bacterium]
LRDGRLCNDTHGISVPLPSGATIGPYDCLPLLPGHVLGFTVADTPVRLFCHLPATAEQIAGGMARMGAVTTETLDLGSHPVLRARGPLPPSPEMPSVSPRVRLLYLRTTPRGVLIFDTTPAVEHEEAVDAATRQALADLRFDDPG